MSRIKFSQTARGDLVRLHQFLAQFDENVAHRAIDEILAAVDFIEAHPNSGHPLPDRPFVRRSVVDFGATGYLVFHKRFEKQDVSFIARIIHQKEWYDEASVGLAEELVEDRRGR
jgi:plasmid stabilization system protein ParE